MNVATHTVAIVCHPKHSNNWDFPLQLAGHVCRCCPCMMEKMKTNSDTRDFLHTKPTEQAKMIPRTMLLRQFMFLTST